MKDWRLVGGVMALVLAVWLIGTWVTRYSLEQMALFAPIAICVVGATIGVVLIWVKVTSSSAASVARRRPDTRSEVGLRRASRGRPLSDAARTVGRTMLEGRWSTRPCDWSRVEALAEALEISETTATVLVRRGLEDPAAARAFLERSRPGTIRSPSETWAWRSTGFGEQSRAASGSACTATTTSTGSPQRRWRF